MNYGLQLFSIRDVATESFEAALKTAAEKGYTLVESAGFFGHTADEVKTLLDKYSLTLCSTHTGYGELCKDFEAVLDFHRKVGCKDIIIPGVSTATAAELDALIENINKWQPMAEAAGMRLHFHNHSAEFMPNKDGLVTEDELARRTNILFEIDTFWVYNAGLDPLSVMEQYKDRMYFIHLKDGIPKDFSDNDSKAQGKSLGSGSAPVEAVLRKAVEMGLTVVVESEGLEPTGPEEVGRCMDYLRTLDI